jgi:cold shock CspA family protein
MHGTIKALKDRWGFVRSTPQNVDYWFHFQDLADPTDVSRLQLGMAVTFELGSYRGREKAVLVKPITTSVRDLLAGGVK